MKNEVNISYPILLWVWRGEEGEGGRVDGVVCQKVGSQ